MSELWKNTSKPLISLSRVSIYLESCFGHMVSIVCCNMQFVVTVYAEILLMYENEHSLRVGQGPSTSSLLLSCPWFADIFISPVPYIHSLAPVLHTTSNVTINLVLYSEALDSLYTAWYYPSALAPILHVSFLYHSSRQPLYCTPFPIAFSPSFVLPASRAL